MRFSERMGFKPAKLELQTDSMSVELRNTLWNLIHVYFLNDEDSEYPGRYSPRLQHLANTVQLRFFKLPMDDLEEYSFSFIGRVKTSLLKADFHQVYDFVEWLAELYAKDNAESASGFCERVNQVLEEERSAYRLVDFRLVPITNETEVEAVNDAATPKVGFDNVAAHIGTAVQLFSDRKKPDYRNCIKEAISAVEAAARTVSGNEKATLGDALKVLEKRKKLHSALRDGFLKIYGYSNDADGIRHAMSDVPELTAADARFMLVSCSTFANYLIEQSKSGVD